MDRERLLQRGELEELKDSLALLYAEFKNTHTALYSRIFDLVDLTARSYEEDRNNIKLLVEKLYSLKEQILQLEERKRYLEKTLRR